MRRSISSADLDAHLKKLVQKKNQVEKEYQDTNQKYWTLLFIDVSSSAKNIWDRGEDAANQILNDYQQITRETLKSNGVSFIEPGGGPQVVCCFESPETGLLAAHDVILVLKEWNKTQPEDLHLLPAIGMHQGYINFHGGTIHQSNTNNIAKRIQTEAGPGQVFVSREIQEELDSNPQFSFDFVGTFSLKNIPEPQDIFEAFYRVLRDIDAFSVPMSSATKVEETSSSRESFQWIFIYIDVCESTKKFWKFGDREASRLIQEYQKLCHTTFQQCGCVYVKSCEGDQIIGAFEPEDANMAVVASIKILKDLFRRNLHVRESNQVRAAIGIHRGEMILENGDPVTTNDMRVGKAIQSLASADEILLSKNILPDLDYQIRENISHYGIYEFPGLSDSYTLYTMNWTHAQLRPSLLYPPLRNRPRKYRPFHGKD